MATSEQGGLSPAVASALEKMLNSKFESMSTQFGYFESRLDGIDQKISKLDAIDQKLVKLESLDPKLAKLDVMDKKLAKLDPIEQKTQKLFKLDTIDQKVTKLETSKLNTHDPRLAKLNTIDQKLAKLDSFGQKLAKLDSLDQKLAKLDVMDQKLTKLDTIEQKTSWQSSVEQKLSGLRKKGKCKMESQNPHKSHNWAHIEIQILVKLFVVPFHAYSCIPGGKAPAPSNDDEVDLPNVDTKLDALAERIQGIEDGIIKITSATAAAATAKPTTGSDEIITALDKKFAQLPNLIGAKELRDVAPKISNLQSNLDVLLTGESEANSLIERLMPAVDKMQKGGYSIH